MMKKGKLITFEGGEGAGKTTQVKMLREYLGQQGQKVTLVREPGSTHVSEQIRAVLADPQNKDMADLTETLLYQAARAQVYQESVIPALKRGEMVLMDRSSDSSVVYQGMVRGMGVAMIERLNTIATGGVKPDLTLLLDVSVRVGFGRKAGEKLDRLEQEGRKFHEQVRQGYLKLAARRGYGRIKVIDGRGKVDEVHEQVLKYVEAVSGDKD
jgi:dTMP kinase